jgi:hypothetical protein
MREVTIKLGGREFVVPQLTIRDEAKWRKQAEEALAPFWDAAGLVEMTFSTPDDLRTMVSKIGALMDPLAALDAVCAYAPQLTAEREWIEENTYSDEVFGALVGLFFGQLRQLERLPQALNGSLSKLSATT